MTNMVAAKAVGELATITRNPLRRPKSIGRWTIGSGRFERVTQIVSSSYTNWQLRRLCPLPFDMVRFKVRLGQTGGNDAVTPNGYAAVASVPNKTDAALMAATPVNALFGGNNNPNFPPSSVLRRATHQWSDWTRVTSVPRDDGGEGYWLVIRLALGGVDGNIITMGDTAGADTFANWADHPTRPFDLLRRQGAVAAAASGWSTMNSGTTNTTAPSTCPVVEVECLYRGMVFNLGTFGDSITDGRGTYLGASFGTQLCSELTAETPVAFEWANYGWSGITAEFIYQNVLDAVAAGSVPDMAFVEGFFTNNVPTTIPADGETSLVPNSTRWMDSYHSTMIQALEGAGGHVVTLPGTPANYSSRPWGAAADARRIAQIARIKAMAAHGRDVLDWATPNTGPVDGNGQQTLINNVDALHLGDAGYAACVPLAKQIVKRRLALIDGMTA